MELSKKERLFLYNQYEILKLLNADDEYMIKQYELNQEILLNGFKYSYGDMTEWILDDTPDDISKFVWDVLQLHRVLYSSYGELSSEERAEIEFDDIKFDGFDGNEEADHYLYAQFILEKMNRFEEIYNDGDYTANSHANRVARYSQMLENWDRFGNGRYKNLSLQQIKKVIE